jgi:hypothetical protein
MRFRISEGDCLSEHGVIFMHQRYRQAPKHTFDVQTITGVSNREFIEIEVLFVKETMYGKRYSEPQKLWADWVTGTLYKKDGKCLSSPQLRLMTN